MAKREISSTLRNLKFMQRSALKEEKKKKIDDDDERSSNFTPSTTSVSKKCVVITDWDHQPGALLGRMSFQSFNPSIEKLNEAAIKTDDSPTSSSSNGGRMSFSQTSQETNGDLKRKQSEEVSEEQNHPSKSPRSSDKPSPSNKKGDGFKKPKSRKAAWSVLKPPKPQTKN
ncbi:hypothetical protein N665_0198s0133 [Sinapis alba]|nr:hypothetical protein N665_0198s0133 [Sinapis alba]